MIPASITKVNHAVWPRVDSPPDIGERVSFAIAGVVKSAGVGAFVQEGELCPLRLYDIAMRVLVTLYFVEVGASGRVRVPVRGPLILASNCPRWCWADAWRCDAAGSMRKAAEPAGDFELYAGSARLLATV